MIVSCPQCDARYEVDAQVLSPNGREVRCAKCGHLWTERPPAEPAELEEVEYVEEDQEFDDFRATRRATGRQTKGKKRGSSIVAWAALAALVAVIIGGSIVAREQIVSVWPSASKIYELVGLEPERGEELSEFQITAGLVDQRYNENNELVYEITGEIFNTTKEVKALPPLEGVLIDASKRILHSWFVRLPDASLNPGESTQFKTSVTGPPEGASEVQFRFPSGS